MFTSWGLETPKAFSQEKIASILSALEDSEKYGMILRAKGILQTPDGDWFQFDDVPGELQLRDSTPDYAGRLVVIGTNIDEKALKALFHV